MNDDDLIPNQTTVRALEESRRLRKLLEQIQALTDQPEPDSKPERTEPES